MDIGTLYQIGGIVSAVITALVFLWRVGSKIAAASKRIDDLGSGIRSLDRKVTSHAESVAKRFDKLEKSVNRVSRRSIDHAVRIAVLERHLELPAGLPAEPAEAAVHVELED